MIDTPNSSPPSSRSSPSGAGGASSTALALDFILNHPTSSSSSDQRPASPALPFDEAAILVSLRRGTSDPSADQQETKQVRRPTSSDRRRRQRLNPFEEKDCNQPAADQQPIDRHVSTQQTFTNFRSPSFVGSYDEDGASGSSRADADGEGAGYHQVPMSSLTATIPDPTSTSSTFRGAPLSPPTMMSSATAAPLPSFRALWPCPPRPSPVDVQPCHPLSLHQAGATPIGLSQTSPLLYSTSAAPLLPFTLGYPSLPPAIVHAPKDPEVPLARHVLSYLRKMQGCSSEGSPCDTPASSSTPATTPSCWSPATSFDRQTIAIDRNEEEELYPATTSTPRGTTSSTQTSTTQSRSERRRSSRTKHSSSSDSDYETSCLQENLSSPEPEKIDAIEQTKRVLEVLLSMDSRLDITQAAFGDSSPSPSSISSEDSGEQTADGRRKRATNHQVRMLEAVYAKEPFPCPAAKHLLAKTVRMSYKSITIWFQNKRARMKKRMARAVTAGSPMLSSSATSSTSTTALGSTAAGAPRRTAAGTATGKRKAQEAEAESDASSHSNRRAEDLDFENESSSRKETKVIRTSAPTQRKRRQSSSSS